MTLAEGVVGVLLAGGKSSRMGGGDKGLRTLGGRPILANVIDRLRPQVADIVVNANGDEARFGAFSLPVVGDKVVGQLGPLAGVHAGLEWAKAHRPGARYIVTVATDTPFFPSDLVERLIEASEEKGGLCIAQSESGTHPVIGLWPVALADALRHSLDAGDRRAGRWTMEHGARKVFFPAIEIGGRRIDPFFNINTPEDLAAAEALLGEMAS